MQETKSRWFKYDHLPEDKQPSSKIFHDMLEVMFAMCPTNSDQRTLAVQSLMDAKDRFVRACILDREARETKATVITADTIDFPVLK